MAATKALLLVLSCLATTHVYSSPSDDSGEDGGGGLTERLLTDVDPASLVSMLGIDTSSLSSAEAASLPAWQYLQMMRAYTAEYFQRVHPTPHNRQSFSFFKQKGSNDSQSLRDAFSRFHLNYMTVDFTDENMVPVDQDHNFLLQREGRLFRRVLSKGLDGFDPLTVLKEHLHLVLQSGLRHPRSLKYDHANQAEHKKNAGAYLWKKIGMLGHVAGVHTFRPKQFMHLHKSGPDDPRGSNMMMLIPGRRWGTRQDKILVVGAHWDTMAASPGFDDNASGVAALMELARALSMADCQPEYTVVLVTLDLEEHGTQGSLAFVQEFLVKRLVEPMGFPGVQGAIILDSIMNFNTSESSQTLPHDYWGHLPHQSADIRHGGSRGDFVAVFSRPFDEQLSRRFRFHWDRLQEEQDGTTRKRTPRKSSRNKNKKKNKMNKKNKKKNKKKPLPAAVSSSTSKYKLREFELGSLTTDKPGDSMLVNYANFLRSDHVRFWYSNHKDYFASFKSILVTDTGPARGVMRTCYHKRCDSAAHNETEGFADVDFLARITQALIDTVVDASQSKCASTRREVEPLGEEPEADYVVRFDRQAEKMEELERRGIQVPKDFFPLETTTTAATTTTTTTATSTTASTTTSTTTTTMPKTSSTTETTESTTRENTAVNKNFRPWSEVESNSLEGPSSAPSYSSSQTEFKKSPQVFLPDKSSQYSPPLPVSSPASTWFLPGIQQRKAFKRPKFVRHDEQRAPSSPFTDRPRRAYLPFGGRRRVAAAPYVGVRPTSRTRLSQYYNQRNQMNPFYMVPFSAGRYFAPAPSSYHYRSGHGGGAAGYYDHYAPAAVGPFVRHLPAPAYVY